MPGSRYRVSDGILEQEAGIVARTPIQPSFMPIINIDRFVTKKRKILIRGKFQHCSSGVDGRVVVLLSFTMAGWANKGCLSSG